MISDQDLTAKAPYKCNDRLWNGEGGGSGNIAPAPTTPSMPGFSKAARVQQVAQLGSMHRSHPEAVVFS